MSTIKPTPTSEPKTTAPSAAPRAWRDVIPVHPAADRFPLLKDTDPKALKALAEDLDKGMTAPLAFWREGPEAPWQLLDGRNRLDALELMADQGWHEDLARIKERGDPRDVVAFVLRDERRVERRSL
jgi:hypothetical protein